MGLQPGTRIGPYEIVSTLGEGGMGVVYRATDTTLGRAVAVKVLPDAFAHDPGRVARFEREARTLAALNHPHIAQVHGFEKSAGVHALVMELVEGPTLADRLAQGPLPVEEALPVARQIAEALEAAHEQGIIHRDLKPANIKIRPDGAVKVLDFGLAKLAGAPDGGPFGDGATPGVDPLDTVSPTIVSPAMTQVGMLLGTAAYMSPEQAKGRPADKRSDIWAFGCVLYEMLTGKRAFDGDGVSDTLAAVLRGQPDWKALPGGLPELLVMLVTRCLQRDRAARVGDVAAVRFALDALAAATPVVTEPRHRRLFGQAAIAAAGLLVAGVSAAAWFGRPALPGVVRSAIVATDSASLLTVDSVGYDLTIAPDGSKLAYVGDTGSALVVRALDAVEPLMIRGLPAARQPSFSPDGEWLAFFEGNTMLKRVAAAGGPAEVVTRVDGSGPRGVTWVGDDEVVFATNHLGTGLMRVSSDGGETTVLTKPASDRGEQDHFWPQALPGRRAVLYTVLAARGGIEAAQIAVLDLDTNTSTILVRGGFHGRYAASGHLVYASGGELKAVAFDVARLEVLSATVALPQRVMTTPFGAADFDIAANGTLTYVAGSAETFTSRFLVWVDRQGRETIITAPPRAYIYPRISPDGNRIAVSSNDQDLDVWLWDARQQTLSRMSFAAGQDSYPEWTPDGRNVVGSVSQPNGFDIILHTANNPGPVQSMGLTSPAARSPTDVSPDGRWIIYYDVTDTADILMLSTAGDRRIVPLVRTPAVERNGTVSPDGRWLAYEADDSGRLEIYVRPFPGTASARWQVSQSGGTRPLWSPRGDELFYREADGGLMAVAVARTASWSTSTPQRVLRGGPPGSALSPPLAGFLGRNYDVSSDGQRFLMVRAVAAGDQQVALSPVLVQNWFEELRRLVPEN